MVESQEAKMVYDKTDFSKFREETENKKPEGGEVGLHYPSMAPKEETLNEDPVIHYPSMEGKGFEEVFIPQPPDFSPHVGIHYGKMENEPDSMALKDSPAFVGKKIREAFGEGNYSILEHYAEVVEGSEFLDQGLMPQVKALAEEGRRIKNAEEAEALLRKVNTFLFGLRMVKRGE
jgi:hypothetical protein